MQIHVSMVIVRAKNRSQTRHREDDSSASLHPIKPAVKNRGVNQRPKKRDYDGLVGNLVAQISQKTLVSSCDKKAQYIIFNVNFSPSCDVMHCMILKY